MKRYHIALLCLIITIAGSSCKKWLDISPKTQVRESEMLSSEQGYKEALTGVYMLLGTTRLYGGQLTITNLELMAQRYTGVTGTTSLEYQFLNYNLTDEGVKSATTAIWTDMYAAIGNLNNILSQIDASKAVFSGNSYNQVKGEALALRAHLHFDLMRMFGNTPVTGMEKPAIPYVTEFKVKVTPLYTLKQVIDSCLADLTAASALLSADKEVREIVDDNDFLSYTRNHMNYWACKGLEARVRLYAGDKAGALNAAKEVIANNNLFPWVVPGAASAVYNKDRTFAREQLFTLYNYNLKVLSDSLFKSANTSATPPFSITTKNLTALFETTTGGSTDLRYLNQFSPQLTVNVTTKYYQDNTTAGYLKNAVPMIRLSEMYYIAAECAGIPDGVTYLNEVRTHRGLAGLASGITATTLTAEILKEYKKEFYAEGQLFYYFKRLNAAKIDGSSIGMTDARYTFLLPADEILYGNR